MRWVRPITLIGTCCPFGSKAQIEYQACGLLESSSNRPFAQPLRDHLVEPKTNGEMNYIGIDVSKAKLDMALLDGKGRLLEHVVVRNTAQAITGRLRRWEREQGLLPYECLACLEPTGSYSDTALRTFVGVDIPTWRAHPLEIKRRMGMVRGKSDKVDALRIADYAMRYQDRKRLVTADTLAVMELKQLLAFRWRVVVDQGRHKGYRTEIYPGLHKDLAKFCNAYSQGRIKQAKAMVAQADRRIRELILSDPTMKRQYELLLSVERIGPLLAAHLIAATERFTRMREGRKLGCHAGVVPHEHSSGSSLRGRPRVSHQADKNLKSVLHMAVLGVAQGHGELGAYYTRKVAEGKNPMSVLNAVRNKVLHRACAVIKRGTPYQEKEPLST